MIKVDYFNYDVELLDIWKYEKEIYDLGDSDQKHIEKLSEEIKSIIYDASDLSNKLDKGWKELFSGTALDSPQDMSVLEEFSTLTREAFFADWLLKSKTTFVVPSDHISFQHMFALKLSQYAERLISIPDFLDWQFKTNFARSFRSFNKFLYYSILQYKDLNYHDQGIRTVINKWLKRQKRLLSPEKDISTTNNNQFDKNLIKIVPDFQQALLSALFPYFNTEEHDKLKQLITGESIKGKVLFLGQANQLTFLLRQMYKNQKVIGQLIDIEDWTCQYFDYRNKRKCKQPFVRSNVHKNLTKSDYSIPHAKRIKVPGLEFIK